MTELFQWLALVALLLIIGALAFVFVRHGVKVKRDPNRKTEDWRDISGGGSS